MSPLTLERWSCPLPTSLPRTWFWCLLASMRWMDTLHPWGDTNWQANVSADRISSGQKSIFLIMQWFKILKSVLYQRTRGYLSKNYQQSHTPSACVLVLNCIQMETFMPGKSFSKTALQIPNKRRGLGCQRGSVMAGLKWIVGRDGAEFCGE